MTGKVTGTGLVFVAILLWSCDRPIGLGQDGGPHRCGDGVAQGEEECDISDFRDLTCNNLGFDSGPLGCSPTCQIDTSACIPRGICGDGIAQAEEECDGSDLKEKSCITMGFHAGQLVCTDDCRYETKHCCHEGGCGDAVINCGEDCDFDNESQSPVLGGVTCEDLGFDGGTLNCRWCAFDTFMCCTDGPCGNEELNCGEDCDTDGLGGPILPWGMGCESLGFSGGVLGCEDCTLDTSGCY